MKKNKFIKSIIMMFFLVGVFFAAKDTMPAATSPVLSDYTAYPPFVVGSSNKANVMILFSNDHTNYYKGYNDTLDIDGDGSADTTYKNTIEYYGYFDPDKCYNYSSNTFVPAAAASSHQCTASRWSGNFLNWLAMAHADFVRKALTGGKRVMDSATKTTLIRADIDQPGMSGHSWNKVYLGADIASYTPFAYNASGRTFRNNRTSLLTKVGNDPAWTGGSPTNTYTVEVEVCNNTIGLEDNCLTYQSVGVTTYKPAGLIVKYADQVRFGLMTYSVDNATDKGGILRQNIRDGMPEINPNGTLNAGISDGIINYINGFSYKGWDPVGEMYYEAVRYFMGKTGPTTTYGCGSGGTNKDDGNFNRYCNIGGKDWIDPIQSYCQKNYIIIVNDEYPSKDHDNLPSSACTSGVSPNDSGINTYNWTDLVGSIEGINGTNQTAANVGCSGTASCALKSVSSLGNVRGICPCESTADGTFNIAGLAYYANTQDLRTGNCGGAACTNSQTITTYAIAFRASPPGSMAGCPTGYQIPGDMNGDGDFLDAGDNRSMNQLYLAAKYGGFEDSDGDNQPYTDITCGTANPDPKCDEWDEDGNGIPDNYYAAEKGADFENAMTSIMADILKRESSGTSASVLATTGEGEGAIYQAYFIPEKTSGSTTITWLGYVQGLFIDKYGNIREDSVADATLSYTGDRILQMSYNTTTQTTDVYRYNDTNGDGDPDTLNDIATLSSITPIWEAGNVLWSTNTANRTIKTSTQDTCTTSTPCATIDFTTANRTTLRPYLRAANDNEAEAIIRYIRGEDTPMTIGGTTYNYRTRTLTIGGTSNTWKLGDVVSSTPTPVTKSSENYDIIYNDATYTAFKTQYLNRRHVVYTGANDGMLHAFNAGFYDANNLRFCDAYTAPGVCNTSHADLGKELFAFIPQSLLPHLKWLTDINYTHVYYVDLKPKVTDARIFTADATHPNGWGTVLIGGMRFGGRDITFTDNFGSGSQQKTFYSAYFALDITDPDASDGSYGKLLWVYTDTTGDLNMTTSYPAVARTGISSGTGTWHVIFGSGPTSYTGASTKSGKIYVLDLATGALSRRFDDQSVLMDNAFMADPITVDVGLDYQVDVVYIGNTYCPSGTGCTSSTWAGKMYRIATGEDTNTANWQAPSLMFKPINTLLNEGQPITSKPSVAMDEKGYLWVFFGTGRFLDTSDRTLDGTERWSFYAIKDTCKPWLNPACVPTYTAPPDKSNDLYDASNIIVCQGGGTTCVGGTDWTTVLNNAANKTGWYVDFSTAGERAVFTPVVLGGLAIWTTYTPSLDACESEGTSNIYAAFYKTGTGYKKFVFDQPGGTTATAVDRSRSLGTGLPSSVGIMITGDNKMVGFVQQSTGTIVQIEETTPFGLRSGVTGWKGEPIP